MDDSCPSILVFSDGDDGDDRVPTLRSRVATNGFAQVLQTNTTSVPSGEVLGPSQSMYVLFHTSFFILRMLIHCMKYIHSSYATSSNGAFQADPLSKELHEGLNAEKGTGTSKARATSHQGGLLGSVRWYAT